MAQLEDNLTALDFEIPAALSARLEAVSHPPTHFPYHFFESKIQSMITGATRTARKPAWYES